MGTLNLPNIIGIIIGIVGILLSIVFYNKTLREREPVFLIDPIRTEIIKSNNLSNAPIKVFKQNGEEVVSDLTSFTFYFWNRGKEPIKSEHILQSLIIQIDNSDAEILTTKILKQSRNVTNLKVQQLLDEKNSVQITFDILERNDGVTGQVIYQGKADSEVKIVGIIEGVKEIFKFPVSFSRLLSKTVIRIFGVLLLLAFWILGTTQAPPSIFESKSQTVDTIKSNEQSGESNNIPSQSIDNESNTNDQKKKNTVSKRLQIILTLLIITAAIGGFTGSYFWTKNDVSNNPSSYIPNTIRPN